MRESQRSQAAMNEYLVVSEKVVTKRSFQHALITPFIVVSA